MEKRLLLLTQKPIIIYEENQKFLIVVEELMSRHNLTPEEDMFLALMVKLIEDFEEKVYSLNLSTPHSRLLHLMKARSLEKIDLFNLLNSQGITWECIDNKLEITPNQARILGDFFHVHPNLFLAKKKPFSDQDFKINLIDRIRLPT